MSEATATYAAAPPVVSEAHQRIQEVSEYYAMIPEDLIRSGNPSAIAVYGALDRIAKGKAQANTALSFLAEFTHLSTKTIQRALAWLEENKFIETTHVGGGHTTNRYHLPFRQAKCTHEIGQEIGQNYPSDRSNLPITREVESKKEESTPEEATASSAPKGAKKPKKRVTQIDEPFRARMREKYADTLGQDVDEEIDKALNHKSRLKAIDLGLYIQGWLNKAVKYRAEDGIGHAVNGQQRNIPANSGRDRAPESRTGGDPRADFQAQVEREREEGKRPYPGESPEAFNARRKGQTGVSVGALPGE